MRVEIVYRNRTESEIDALNVSFLVRDPTGIDLFGTTTFDEMISLPALAAGDSGRVVFEFTNPLPAGGYGISAAVTRVTRRDLADVVVLDQIDAVAAFESLARRDSPVYYKVHVPVEIRIDKAPGD